MTNNHHDVPVQRLYEFAYDRLGQYMSAFYATDNSGVWTGEQGNYNEKIPLYDKNSNIKELDRWGTPNNAKTQIDDLQYGPPGSGTFIKA